MKNIQYIRKEGVKDSVELIREDKMDEFISYIEDNPIRFQQIFGTNARELTPIEYSVLFGSVAIFKYLYLKNVNNIIEDTNSNIIYYAVQGRNYEIIHLLEEGKGIIKELNNQ